MKVFTDGGARGNPGPAAAGFLVYGDAGDLREKRGKPFVAQGKYLGVKTNNEAEYLAVIEALTYLQGHSQDKKIEFFLDSNLVVNQLNGIFKVKEARLRELLVQIRGLEQALSPAQISYVYIPREKNFAADRLVNETLETSGH